ncbi:MAG: TraB/GumN family protein, partial [Chitinophagales bacterium]|nr:TraB/GumN family protein [Chitinophagales bacterium]
TLSMLFSTDEYAMLDSLVMESTGLSLAMFDKMQPIIMTFILGQRGMNQDSDIALDWYLFNIAKSARKKTFGLETVDEQLEAMQVLPYTAQAQMLRDEMQYLNNSDIDTLFHYYMNEQLDSLLSYSRKRPMPEQFELSLITLRNHRLAKRMHALFRKHSTFCVVGALHLPGEQGIISLLRKEGLIVKQVK